MEKGAIIISEIVVLLTGMHLLTYLFIYLLIYFSIYLFVYRIEDNPGRS
jgi:hypothetical protein